MHTLLSQLFCEVSNLSDKGESNECNQGMVQVVVCTRAFLQHFSPQNLQASEHDSNSAAGVYEGGGAQAPKSMM